MARHTVIRGGRSARRLTNWFASADDTDFTAIAAGAAILDQSFTGAIVAENAPFTIIRTVGQVAVQSDQVAAVEAGVVGFGGMVVQESARAGGVGNIPTPITEMGDEAFFLYQLAHYSGGPVEGQPIRVYSFDSRAARKVESGSAIVFTAENATNVGAIYSFWFRMLVKVH